MREIPSDDPAGCAAAVLVDFIRDSIAARGRCVLALSGGRSPRPMFERLRSADLDWPKVTILQVDERVAPPGHPDRNLTHLRLALADHVPAALYPIPVEVDDPEAAARAYEVLLRVTCGLTPVLDVLHLGLGADGHTASLIPDDPVVRECAREVAATGTYQGRRRVTLTAPVLSRARQAVWLVGDADRRDALDKLRRGDPSIPASRVRAPGVLVSRRRAGP